MKALIIEDEALSSRRMARLLKEINEGIEIISICESLAEAKIFLQSNNLDLVFSDICLQDGDIFEIIGHCQNKPLWIFSSAHDHLAEKAFRSYAFDFLLKPIRINELKETVVRARNHLLKASNEHCMINKSMFSILIRIGFRYNLIRAKKLSYIYHKNGLVIVVNRNKSTFPINLSLAGLLNHIDDKMLVLLNKELLVQLEDMRKMLNLSADQVRLIMYPAIDSDLVNKRHELKFINRILGGSEQGSMTG